MITPEENGASAPQSESLFPASTRVYVPGSQNPALRVPLREIALSDTNHPDGRVEQNAPVRVYDTSGPWGDPDFTGDVANGLPGMRRDWVLQTLSEPPDAGAFDYRNAHYVIAGTLLEEVAGEPWEVLVERDLFGPLGMTRSGLGPPRGEHQPWGHAELFGEPSANPPSIWADNPTALGPAGTSLGRARKAPRRRHGRRPDLRARPRSA